MTTPVIRAVRKHYPNAHITLLAKPWVIPVFHHNPHIDEIMVYENGTRHTKGWGTLRLAKDLRKKEFDCAILMQNAFEAALITFLAAIPRRIGYNTDGRTLLLSPSIKLNPKLKRGHLIDYYRGILKGASILDDGGNIEIFLTKDEMRRADEILNLHGLSCDSKWIKISKTRDPGDSAHGINPDQFTKTPVIGINPGATGGTAKQWFPEAFARLANRLSHRFGVKILVFGGPEDEALGDDIHQKSGGVCVNVAGKTSLREAFALIHRCDLFITNDSGLMHAAAALDTPQIGIIGPTRYLETGPVGQHSRIVRVPVSCNPCKNDHCPVDHACMSAITVDMVFDAAVDKLDDLFKKSGKALCDSSDDPVEGVH